MSKSGEDDPARADENEPLGSFWGDRVAVFGIAGLLAAIILTVTCVVVIKAVRACWSL